MPRSAQAYDRFGHAAAQGGFGAGGPGAGFGGFGGFGDIFEDFFGGFGGMRGAQRGPARGDDLRYDMEITFQEAVFGAEKEIEIPRLETCPQCQGCGAEPGTKPIRCPQCNGTGEVRRAQQTILGQFVSVTTCPRCNGEREIATDAVHELPRAEACARDPAAVGQHPGRGGRRHAHPPGGRGRAGRARRSGGQPVRDAARQAAPAVPAPGERHPAGAVRSTSCRRRWAPKLEVPTLDGKTKLTIPPGTQHGDGLPLRGKGVPILRSNRRGDQLVSCGVVVPDKLDDKQRKLLQELGESLGLESLGKDTRNIFEKFLDAVGNAWLIADCDG